RGDAFPAGLHAGEDADLVAARAAELHVLLAHAAVTLAVRPLHVLDDEDGVAERRVADRRGRQGDDVRRAAARAARLDEHAGAELAGTVFEERLHADVARRLVDDGLEGLDRPRLGRAAEGVRGHLDGRADRELAELLLRHGEVHVRGTERLKRQDRRADGEVLDYVQLSGDG